MPQYRGVPPEETGRVTVSAGEVSVAFDGPASAGTIVVLGHGAGADIHSDFMTFMTQQISDDDTRVCRFNFAYMEKGKRAPDRNAVLEQTFADVVEQVRGDHDVVVLGGKSLGGRIASQAVAAGVAADGLVFLGYPLHPPGRPERLRDAHLADISIPMLFVQGTRDPFCPLPTLNAVVQRLAAAVEIAVIEDGDHSLKVRARSGRTIEQAWNEAAGAAWSWLHRLH